MVKLWARSRTVRVPGTRYGDLIVKTGGRKGLQGGISTNKTTIRSFLSSNDPNNTDFVFEFFQIIIIDAFKDITFSIELKPELKEMN